MSDNPQFDRGTLEKLVKVWPKEYLERMQDAALSEMNKALPEIVELSLRDPELMDKLHDYQKAGYLVALNDEEISS